MRPTRQFILSLTLIALQTVAASAHVLHHAVEYAGAESACGCDTASAAVECDPQGHQDEGPHDCQDCAFCDATTDEVRIASAPPSRLLDLDTVPSAIPQFYLSNPYPTKGLPAVPGPALAPQALHAITLPLLN